MQKHEFYDNLMPKLYARDLKFVNWRIEEIEKLIKQFVPKESSVFEIGCGYGAVTKHLSKIAKKVTAIDLSPAAIELAKKYVNRKNCTFKCQNIFEIPIPQKFDVVVACDVIEHIEKENRPIFLFFVAQLLNENGIAIFTWPNPKAQAESNQIIEVPVYVADILALTDLNLFHFSYVSVDGENQYIHCVLKKRVPFIKKKRSIGFKLKNLLRKFILRVIPQNLQLEDNS